MKKAALAIGVCAVLAGVVYLFEQHWADRTCGQLVVLVGYQCVGGVGPTANPSISAASRSTNVEIHSVPATFQGAGQPNVPNLAAQGSVELRLTHVPRLKRE